MTTKSGSCSLAPLAGTPVRALEDLFREQLACWDNVLSWDYSPTLEVIKKFVGASSLPGFAARLPDGSICGYTYYVIDHPVAYIGDVFVTAAHADKGIYERLIDEVVDHLTKQRRIERIESQAFDFNYSFHRVFGKHGFHSIKRYFLEFSVADWEPEDYVDLSNDAVRIVAWQDKFLLPASEVIFDGYRFSHDRKLCHDYQSLKGCLRFLRNLIENPGCGRFSKEETLVAIDRSDRVCGVLLATRTRSDTGMIPQISICRDQQGKGIGTRLMRTYLNSAGQSRLRRITLSVSEGNERAYRLYEKLGFRIRKTFHAYIWSRE